MNKKKRKKKVVHLWIRLGDAGDYQTESSVEDLAELLAGQFKVTDEFVKYGRYGITDRDKFNGYNYISLFYGDEDANPTQSITQEELTELNRRIKEWHKNKQKK